MKTTQTKMQQIIHTKNIAWEIARSRMYIYILQI